MTHGAAPVVINTRNLGQHLTGVQRYTTELLSRIDDRIRPVGPSRPLMGLSGHAWEQLRLPSLVGDRLLWSPGNTGPLGIRRQVVTIHDIVPLDHPEWVGGRFGAWYRWLLPRLVRRVARVITDSAFIRDRLVAMTRVDRDRVVVVPLGVDPKFHVRTPEEIGALRGRLGIPDGRYLLSLGSLEPRKNLHRLLDAWRLLLPEVPDDFWLVVAGAPARREVFGPVAFGDVPERVYWTGWVPDADLPALYSGATAFAYPSLYEGFGLPPLEALSCGVPSVVSNETSLPEVMGDAALFVDVLDVRAIAGALHRLVMDTGLRACLRSRGTAWAAQFTWERTMAKSWAVLEAALGEPE